MSKRIIPGIHSVIEAIKIRPKEIDLIWLREGELKGDLQDIQHSAQKNGIKIKRSSPQGMDKIVQSHQGVIAESHGRPEWNGVGGAKRCLILALDQVEDPHNIGSVVRSSWNLGVNLVIFTKERSGHWGPAAQKVATGGFEHVPFIEVSNLASELKTLKEQGFWIYGLSESGEKRLSEVEFPDRVILVVGSEGFGIRRSTEGEIDATVHIPQAPGSNSYNASVATALAMYEIKRQWEFT
ncbi:MAG: 23S rRNA (guanosine(2251)-2'-O)-methyltransferase RlmB [Oligoflexia bacterium]|nr:23S rRNA (guanosine(2251)-2'-O)-methyltransferase RlmB [Oligoflexia bacterium]